MAWFIAEFGGLIGLVASLLGIGGFLRWLVTRNKPVEIVVKNTEALNSPRPNIVEMTQGDFIALTKKLRDQAYAERDQAHGAEKSSLEDRIAELNRRLANPEEALAQQHAIIVGLEEKLDRLGNDIGGDRIAEAKAALEQGDYSVADDIFAEIEAREQMAVQSAARAAFGRGEVAEAQVRWHDAYEHYKRAVGLHETMDHLKAYALMTWRLAKGAEAVAVYEKLVAIAKAEFGKSDPRYAVQLNNLASVVRAQGRYPESEALFCEALEIGAATIGTVHPDYAINLNNLAIVVQDQGRYSEAEGFFREALGIDSAAIGTAHPAYANHLNNLANVVQEQGRYSEAEALYREALVIDEATIGTAHPDYAAYLANLGVNLAYQKKYAEARALLEQALAIQKAALPADHPEIASTESSLAAVIAKLS